MADELDVNNQESDPNEGAIRGSSSGSGSFSIESASGDIKNVRKEGDAITLDFNIPKPSQSRRPTPGRPSRTARPAGGADSATDAPASGAGASSSAPPATGTAQSSAQPYQHPDSPGFEENTSPGATESSGASSTTPSTLDPDAQQNAAGDMQSDQQKQDPNGTADQGDGKSSMPFRPDYNDPKAGAEAVTNPGADKNPSDAATSDAHPDNMMKGDMGNTEGAEPPKISPEQQQKAAADTAARSQAEQQQTSQMQQGASLRSEENDLIKQASRRVKSKVMTAAFANVAKKIPFVGRYIRQLESASGRGMKQTINILEKLKLALKVGKTGVAVTEAMFNFLTKVIAPLCETGIGIIVAIIIIVPGIVVVAIMALIYPNGVSRLARFMDKLIKYINYILIPLKKSYTIQQQQQGALRRNKQMQVSVDQNQVQPPPRPS